MEGLGRLRGGRSYRCAQRIGGPQRRGVTPYARMYWLAYRAGKDRCVMIVRAKSLVVARLRASMAVDGVDEHFVEGHELTPFMRRCVPARMVGRLLTAKDAERILDRMTKERQGRP
jgi:hypothetical protein